MTSQAATQTKDDPTSNEQTRLHVHTLPSYANQFPVGLRLSDGCKRKVSILNDRREARSDIRYEIQVLPVVLVPVLWSLESGVDATTTWYSY
jgi:hypothetical protein